MPVCSAHIVVIADNISTMHVYRCAYNSCNTVQFVHMPMLTSELWFTFNRARTFSYLSLSHIAYITWFRRDAHTSTKYEFKSCFTHAQHLLQLIIIKLLGTGRGRICQKNLRLTKTTPASLADWPIGWSRGPRISLTIKNMFTEVGTEKPQICQKCTKLHL